MAVTARHSPGAGIRDMPQVIRLARETTPTKTSCNLRAGIQLMSVARLTVHSHVCSGVACCCSMATYQTVRTRRCRRQSLHVQNAQSKIADWWHIPLIDSFVSVRLIYLFLFENLPQCGECLAPPSRRSPSHLSLHTHPSNRCKLVDTNQSYP